jgi:CHAT domain-containing protein
MRHPKTSLVLLGLLSFVVFVLPVSSQTPKGADVLAAARKLYSAEGPNKALPEFERALSLFRSEGDRKGEAITIGLIGNCYKKLGQSVQALEYLQRALTLKRELGDRAEEGRTLNHIGLFYYETSNYAKGIDPLNSALSIARELKDEKLEAAALNNLGLIYDELGDLRHSLEVYKAALEIYQKSEPTEAMADTIGNIGGRHLLLGEYATALGFYQQALAIDQRLELKPKIVLDLENIGLSFVGLGRNQEALQSLDRAIAFAHDAGLKQAEADCRKAKASALLQLGQYGEALDQYNQALQVYQRADGEPQFKQNLIEGLGDLGNLELRLGDVASAERNFRRAIQLAEEIKHPRGITINLISLGDVLFRQKRVSEAAALYSQALAKAVETADKGNEANARIQLSHANRSLKKFVEAEQQAKLARDTAKSTQARPTEAEATYALAEAFRENKQLQDSLSAFTEGSALATDLANPELSWRFDFGRGQCLEDLARNDQALAAYEKAVSTIETVRGELREERFRAGYIEDKYQVYIALVQLLLKLNRPDEAFVTAEKLRARSYLDLINRGQPPIRNQVQRQKEETLRNRLRDLQKHLEEQSTKPNRDEQRQSLKMYSQELMAAESEYENFLDDLTSTEPVYREARSLNVLSESQVRERLPRGTALVEYVVGENELVIFALTAEGLHAKSVSTSAQDLTSRVQTLHDLLRRTNTREWKLPSAALYKTLIGPIIDEGWLKGISQLYIIPHAILHYVPFAALQNKERFLIDDFVIAYLPAAVALNQTHGSGATTTSMLAMAPANTRLQYTRLESQSVSTFFPKQHTLLVGTQATESSFKKLANQFDFIHLATHGYFNKANPLLSGLVLEPNASEDGRLEVHEVLQLRLKAQLVALSACETAVGSGYFSDVPQGDDLVGLTRAFLSTGASSVLATLWEVNDRSAVNLMDEFYRELRTRDKATALTIAQRQMLARGRYRHPFYWAPFVMAGQMK